MIKRSCLCAALMLVLAGTSPVLAQSEARHAVELQAQDLGTALRLLAQQTKLQIVYSAELVQGKRAPALDGSLTATEALSRLLKGSGLEYEFLDAQTVTLSPIASSVPERSGEAGGTGIPGAAPAAEGEHAAATPSAPVPQDRSRPAAEGEDRAQDLEKITVTGTRIRGGSTPSPVITIGSERIQEEGFTDLGEVIRSIPQNFSGGQNPGVIPFTISGAGAQNTNLSGGSALNLRGLGADATLTLLNGRRMAYDGISQAVDISAIPVEAVERVEIVADGASAIYGSDAVGGVGNVILKRDFEGVSLGVGYGTAEEGGLTTREYAATAAHRWFGGGLMVTYKDVETDPVYARHRSYTRFLRDPYTIYPGSDLRSGLISLYQALGANAELQLDAFRTERSQAYGAYDNRSNVYIQAEPDATTTLLSPRVEVFLPNDWTLSIGTTRSRNGLHHEQSILLASTGALLQQTRLCYCNEGSSYEAGAEGPLFALAGGDARLAVGAGRRESEFLEFNKVTDTAAIQGDEATRFAYVELHLPLLGDASSAARGRRMALTAAARHESYDSFGSVLTPKLGVVYSPGADLTLKASWGRSFKAPTLFQLNRQRMIGYNYATAYGGSDYPPGATVLLLDGGNRDLEPERARTWNASLAVHPAAVPGLEAELTWFDIDYTDRVVAPIMPTSQALRNPAFAEFVAHAPTAQEQADAIGGGTFLNYIGVPYDPASVVALVHAYYTNVASQRIRGLDLSASYGFDLAAGRLTLRGSSSWLRSTQQATAAEFDLAGTLHNPPELVGRIGAVWTRAGTSASVFANYKGGVENLAASEKTASFTTVDTTVRYTTAGGEDASRHWTFAASVQNLFNRPPPLHDTSVLTPYLVPPYDATNYSAIGRFFHVSVSKHW